MAVLTLEEYQNYKEQGMTDTQIAVRKNTSPNYVWKLKKQWQIIPKQPDTVEIKQKECSCKGKEQIAKYEAEIKQLKEAFDHAQAINEKLNQSNEELQESKRRMQGEYDKLKNKEYKDSYMIEEQRKRIEHLGKALQLLTKENTYLWGLIGLQVMEKHV
jgi:predicted RNase H-like nuclease (RuvC/YqgF family)